ncbi:ATP-binding protein [Desulfopila aestuarii]|uniref:AAA-like domain-containing protein n=1 Tax=Desulfopila aestuarii DSM 18488 TaxID=1121416 RepID=A0A1M7Y4H4_9BACT|nr:DUF87 domain-containing protein [Desulfopila aestuarii]SHO47215.1 AAA-like domain-containing protein [Desulfopila aestuarii DSM 18488]
MENYAYEKLGLFYLGRELDAAHLAPSPAPLLYKSNNLTTHAAIIGMTGSGKTGLGIALIEEAIMDNIPSIIIDPKGDMGNLLLTFPGLRPDDFQPWIDPKEAARKGLGVEEYAAKTATTWREGLSAWDQGGERIGELKARTEMTIYTPGSTAGVPVSVLGNIAAPTTEVLDDLDTLNSLINSTVTSLLTLIGVQSEPLQSKEHILLSSILLHFWRKGEDLQMEQLIGTIVSPPFDKVGVFPLDTFYPQSERMGLAMSFNNILASPTFSAWLTGEPLDIQRLLYTEEGKPRSAIFSIAHLSESERMFFVTMLLGRFIDWMRRQSGTSSLKALLYMDEIFGYFPPIANPPSKKPMLLLLKQARAYGCGVVLATQNPVDLDYKGLANIGSWFIGRLQTSQDQERVAEGIAGGSGGTLAIGEVKSLLSGMKGRQFLLRSAHLDAPVLFETRWVMSYLRGPIAASDIRMLMAGSANVTTTVSQPATDGLAESAVPGEYGSRPVLSPDISQYYAMQNVVSDKVVFEPWLFATGKVRFVNTTKNIDEVRQVGRRIYLSQELRRFDWLEAEETLIKLADCGQSAPEGSQYYPLPAAISGARNLQTFDKGFRDYLYHNERLELQRVAALKLESRPGESVGDFRVRLQDVLREKKAAAVEKLQKSYGIKQQRLEDQLQKAMYRLEKEQLDVKTKTVDTVLSFGVAVVGALFGRKAISTTSISRTASGMRSAGRVVKEKADVQRAKEQMAELQQALKEFSSEIEQQAMAIGEDFAIERYEMEPVMVKPKKSDIYDVEVAILWEQGNMS